MESHCVTISSPYGTMGLAWRAAPEGVQVVHIYLPNRWAALPPSQREAAVSGHLPAPLAKLVDDMRRFLDGQPVELSVELLALGDCTPFQRRVLAAEYGVPRGRVSTYGRLAAHIGLTRGARAVGGALASNPFPIVIPCHRTIAADGSLGGFGGGLEMKRGLLQAEGVVVEHGRVSEARYWY